MGRRKKTENLHLPERVTINKGKYYYIPKHPEDHGGKKWVPLGKDLKSAEKTLSDILKHTQTIKDNNWIKNLYQRCKWRAKERNLAFTLTLDQLLLVTKRANGLCEVSGLPFSFYDGADDFSRRPLVPSIDRINSDQGYTIDNIRLVCSIVNTAISNYPDELFLKLCQSTSRNKEKIVTKAVAEAWASKNIRLPNKIKGPKS